MGRVRAWEWKTSLAAGWKNRSDDGTLLGWTLLLGGDERWTNMRQPCRKYGNGRQLNSACPEVVTITGTPRNT